jgi:hypothetical protein
MTVRICEVINNNGEHYNFQVDVDDNDENVVDLLALTEENVEHWLADTRMTSHLTVSDKYMKNV